MKEYRSHDARNGMMERGQSAMIVTERSEERGNEKGEEKSGEGGGGGKRQRQRRR